MFDRLQEICFKIWLFERYLKDNNNDTQAQKIRDKYIEMLRLLLSQYEENYDE